jgi:endonuclease/exonuclease/phosphatase family metal-dependent hydrolase
VIELFNEMHPDIICTQEQYQHQLDAWLPQLGNHYSFYGSPRGDGEVNGVIYRNDRFKLIQGSVIVIPSLVRPKPNTVTMVQLKDLKTGKSLAVFNTHMTFSSNNERELEAEFIIQEMSQVSNHMPVILAGDLNTFPCRLDQPFPFFDGDYVHRILTKSLLKDSQEVALLGHVGPLGTFTNVDGDKIPFKGLGTPGAMLDHVYVGQGIEVLIHAVEGGTIDGCFPSDHMPVVVDFIIP